MVLDSWFDLENIASWSHVATLKSDFEINSIL